MSIKDWLKDEGVKIAIAIFIGLVLTIPVRFAARYDYLLLIIARFVTGFAHGMLWPAISTLWSFWAPPANFNCNVKISVKKRIINICY